MPFYESVFIARQDISAAQVDGLAETFEKVIKDQGGTVTKTEQWGLRSLAYRIKKNRKGYYVLMNIDAPAPAIHEMERQMRINEDIIRNLTTRVEELEEGPSAVIRNKERGDERGRRGGRDDRRPRDRDRDRPRDKDRDKAAAAEKKAAEKKAPEKKADEKADEKPDEKAEKKAGKKTADKKAEKKVAPEKADEKPDKAEKKAAPEKADEKPDKAEKKAGKNDGGDE